VPGDLRAHEETAAAALTGDERPEVSVIVPARNEIASIDRCLDSILSQEGCRLEVVVVDNGSTDGTTERLHARAAEDRRLVVLSHDAPSIPASLNTALAAARGEWLVRVDAHSTIPPGYVARAVSRLTEGRWSGVGGRKTAVARTGTGQAIAAALNSPLAVGGSIYHYGTTEVEVDHIPFGAYRTEALRRLGGWDESVHTNEDFELDQRLRETGRLLFDPELEIAWNVRETLPQLWRQYLRYGSGKPMVAARHPGRLKLRHLAPPALVLWLAGALGLAARRPLAGGIALAPYVLVVGGSSALIARKAPATADRRALPAALVIMQVGWGLGFWKGVLDLLRSRVSR
jgi:succinoglycan biosynthesis protein ExoA